MKSLARRLLIAIGLAFALFCLLLVNIAAIRLYGWSQTGRFAPPTYPRLDRYDVISFSTEPLRLVLEIGGNAFLFVTALCGLVAVILMFVRGLRWLHNWPDVLPLTLLMVFLATASATLVGHTDWVLPVSAILGLLTAGAGWISLWRRGQPLSARVSDAAKAAESARRPDVEPRGSGWRIAAAALLFLLALEKLFSAFRY